MNSLNRLLLWQKLTLLGIIALLLVAVPLTLFIKESSKSVSAAALEARGLAPARAVLTAVTLMQQHRGMSAMYLNGNTGVETQRAAKQQEVTAALATAAPVISAIGHDYINQIWASTQQNWALLPQKVAQRTIVAPQSFAEHTVLISDLLKVNELIIDHYGLALDPDPANSHLIDVALMQSPQLTETLGRMRARGSSILTTGTATLQERATMVGMQSRSTELYKSIESALEKAITTAPELKAALDAPLRQTLTVGRETMKLTEEQIVLPDAFTYAGPDYFAKTTEAIGVQLKLYDTAIAELDRLLQARQSALRNTALMLVACVLVLTLLAVAFGVLITRSITGPIRDAIGIARRIAAGDLSLDIAVTSKNEVGQLQQALKDMNGSLVKIVGEVRSGTDTIASASAQIATANMDLSARTEEQASTLEETASSMEEITGTVKQNADSARQANVLARTASDIASKGGAMVDQVVETMSAIDASSRKVAEIISVINGIAFQTNILALNAAVEAARAGEQGRGFAVVATEVRSLAQRSASAAKEIEGLIKDSVARTSAGAKLASQTGATMDEIVTSIRSVSDIISDIANASDEQSIGIGQVNQAVSEMDSTTQQNAALVEQAAAAAEALKEQADDLAELVSVFKLGAAHETSATWHDREVARTVAVAAVATAASLRLAHQSRSRSGSGTRVALPARRTA